MWVKKFTKLYQGVCIESIWQAWADVNHWPKWDRALEFCELKADFSEGNQFILKAMRGPEVKLILCEVIPYERFTDYCKFFGATIYDAHELEETADGVKITNTITVTGLLALLWVKLVAKNVANSVPQQTDSLIEYVRSKDG